MLKCYKPLLESKYFKAWVIDRYSGSDSPKGDFAHDIKRDKVLVSEDLDYAKLSSYFENRTTNRAVIRIFKQLGKEFEKHVNCLPESESGKGA